MNPVAQGKKNQSRITSIRNVNVEQCNVIELYTAKEQNNSRNYLFIYMIAACTRLKVS